MESPSELIKVHYYERHFSFDFVEMCKKWPDSPNSTEIPLKSDKTQIFLHPYFVSLNFPLFIKKKRGKFSNTNRKVPRKHLHQKISTLFHFKTYVYLLLFIYSTLPTTLRHIRETWLTWTLSYFIIFFMLFLLFLHIDLRENLFCECLTYGLSTFLLFLRFFGFSHSKEATKYL